MPPGMLRADVRSADSRDECVREFVREKARTRARGGPLRVRWGPLGPMGSKWGRLLL